MKEHPILFSTPMVQAILQGRKTMTRRIVKGKTALDWLKPDMFTPEFVASPENNLCPYGNVGDLLWVRETFEVYLCNDGGEDYTQIRFISDGRMIRFKTSLSSKKHPSIHMPKEAAQIWLEVKDVKVERLQDISEEDAIAEGVEKIDDSPFPYKNYLVPNSDWAWATGSFESLWQSINGEESWKQNPWVWVIQFKVLSTTGKHLAVVEETNEA